MNYNRMVSFQQYLHLANGNGVYFNNRKHARIVAFDLLKC